MKIIISLIIFLCFSSTGIAQELQYQTSDSIKNYDYSTYYIHSTDKENVYAFTWIRQRAYLDVFDRNSLKLTSTIPVPLPSFDTLEYKVEKLLISGDTLQVFYSYYNKVNLLERLYMINFDRAGKRYGQPVLIDQSEGKNDRKAGSMYVARDENKNEFISYGYKTKRDSVFISVSYFNNSGTRLRTQTNALEIEDKIINQALDHFNNLYVFSPSGESRRKLGLKLNVFSPGEMNRKTFLLHAPAEKLIVLSDQNRIYTSSRHHMLYFICPYIEYGTDNAAKGVYVVQYDILKNEVRNEKIIDFDNWSKTHNISMSSCIPVYSIIEENGGIQMFFESRLHVTSGFYGIPLEQDFMIGNIISLDLDSNMNVEDIRDIRKTQNTNLNKYKYTGFCIIRNSNKTYLVYNELLSNLNRKPADFKKLLTSRLDDAMVIYTSVDSGKVKRHPLIIKSEQSEIDAILPYSSLFDEETGELFAIRRIKDDYYLTRFYFK
jgi:hypothetical protein